MNFKVEKKLLKNNLKIYKEKLVILEEDLKEKLELLSNTEQGKQAFDSRSKQLQTDLDKELNEKNKLLSEKKRLDEDVKDLRQRLQDEENLVEELKKK